jgi:hypothetical protein
LQDADGRNVSKRTDFRGQEYHKSDKWNGRARGYNAAGIAENSPLIRERVAQKLARLGITLDASANATGRMPMSPGSRPRLYVVPTNEQLKISRHTLALSTRAYAAAVS